MEVLFLSNDSLYKIRTQPVVGDFEPREALERMLQRHRPDFRFRYRAFGDYQTAAGRRRASAAPAHSVLRRRPRAVGLDASRVRSPPLHRTVSRGARHGQSHSHGDGYAGARASIYVQGFLDGAVSDGAGRPISASDQLVERASRGPVPQQQLQLRQLASILRGLGVAATLVLVNGHRQPLSGLNGEFVDVSNIPLAAVDRIEIVPDGASAAYGSDAIAGVVNIIMKDDFQGAETQVRYGGTPGGRDDITASQLLRYPLGQRQGDAGVSV